MSWSGGCLALRRYFEREADPARGELRGRGRGRRGRLCPAVGARLHHERGRGRPRARRAEHARSERAGPGLAHTAARRWEVEACGADDLRGLRPDLRLVGVGRESCARAVGSWALVGRRRHAFDSYSLAVPGDADVVARTFYATGSAAVERRERRGQHAVGVTFGKCSWALVASGNAEAEAEDRDRDARAGNSGHPRDPGKASESEACHACDAGRPAVSRASRRTEGGEARQDQAAEAA
jgi:hypothetical protein